MTDFSEAIKLGIKREKYLRHIINLFDVIDPVELKQKYKVTLSFIDLHVYIRFGEYSGLEVIFEIDVTAETIMYLRDGSIYKDYKVHSLEELQEMYDNDKFFQLSLIADWSAIIKIMDKIKSIPELCKELIKIMDEEI